jgi:hypothetical protein
MLADGKAFEEMLSLHMGPTGYGHSPLIWRDMEGVRRGHADYTLEHALGDGVPNLMMDDGQR